jgi:hypothetical protein
MQGVASKSEGEKIDVILADATDRLLRATKKKMLRESGRIGYRKLAREGVSPALIDRLKAL